MTIDTSAKLDTALPTEFVEKGSPEIKITDVPLCVVCGHDKFTPFASGYDYESLTSRNLWHFVSCSQCGHVWLNPRPAVEELSTIYPPTYYAYHYDSMSSIAVQGKAFLDRLKMQFILKQLGRFPKSFLDIGCGNGRFLKSMKDLGVEKNLCYGLELDDEVVNKLQGDGYSVFCERVEDATQIPSKSIDLATMFHVIEHVDNPHTTAERIADWMAPGGLFAVETPNFDSLDARLFHNHYWGGYHIPRHWHLFNPKNLEKLLTDVGFEVIGLQYQTGHSFWMYSFHHLLRYQYGWRRASALFNPMYGLPSLIFFTGIDKLRGLLGARTSSMLMLARKR
jgi:2-polyprenyl-3-methyl-5-hydroxy-6-metoxy-1,4-benzoquinol methylase